MESNFIINCSFFLVVVEVAQKLQFLIEYGELETVKPGDRVEAIEKKRKSFGCRSILESKFITIFFGLFFGADGAGGEIAISQ